MVVPPRPRAGLRPLLQRRDGPVVDPQIQRIRRDEGILERRVLPVRRARLVPLARRLVVVDVLEVLHGPRRAVFRRFPQYSPPVGVGLLQPQEVRRQPPLQLGHDERQLVGRRHEQH